jgi:hypothetical protein
MLFKLYSEDIIKEMFEGYGEFKTEGQVRVIRTVKYTADFVLLAKEETAGMADKIIGRKTLWNGMVRLSALSTGRLYLPGNTPDTHFCKRLCRPPPGP